MDIPDPPALPDLPDPEPPADRDPVVRPPPPGDEPRPREPLTDLPHDDEAERGVLSALLVRPDEVQATTRTLTSRMFYRDAHRAIYEAVVRLQADGVPPDLVTLRNELIRTQDLDRAGGLTVLLDLLNTGVSRHAPWYARIVAEQYRRRRMLRYAERLEAAALRGDREAIRNTLRDAPRAGDVAPCGATGVRLDDVEPTYPEWLVRDLLPVVGTVMFWAAPNAGKTYLLLRAAYEMLAEPQPEHLWTHPDLHIGRNVGRVLWIATEEVDGRLSARRQAVQAGLGHPSIPGDLLHFFAADADHPITLLDLPEILERYAPVQLVICDSLTGLRPRVLDGRRISWDLDNDSTNELCLILRGLAERHRTCIVVVHHTARRETGYRGPIEWQASVDVMFGLESDPVTGQRTVSIQKNREGRILRDFRLALDWTPDGFVVDYNGDTVDDATAHAQAILGAIRESPLGRLTQAQIVQQTGLPRATVQRALRALEAAGALAEGAKVGRSPVFGEPEGLS